MTVSSSGGAAWQASSIKAVTGVVFDTMDEALRMLPRVLALDRHAVRRRFEQRFFVRAHVHGLYRALPFAAQAAAHIGVRDDRAAATTGIRKKVECTG